MDDHVVITLFRHGLTEGNKRKAYMGWNDSPLSEEAREMLGTYTFKEQDYDAFFSSDIKRCLNTMNILFPFVNPLLLSEFREMNFGVFQGKTYEEIKDDGDYQAWVNDFFHGTPPQGESFTEFTARVEEGWKKVAHVIIQEGKRRPFIVTHGGVIRYILKQFGPEKKDYWDWKIAHGHGYEMTFDLGQLRRGERCILLQEVPLTESELG